MGKVMEETNICLNLLVDVKANKVLFAEAGKDFVDFLFNLLKLPIGYLVGQLTSKSVFGSLGNIFPIMNNFYSATYMQPNEVLGNAQNINTWLVTDNLVIAPSSAFSVISVIKEVKAELDALEQRMIQFHISDLEKEFLLVSLKSNSVLTNVFLRQTSWRKSKNGEKCSLKLIVEKKTNRVVLAEAGKDFFCFLISLIQLPIGTIIDQTTSENRRGTSMFDCIGNVYRSVKNQNEAYMQSSQTKGELIMAGASKSWSEALKLLHEFTTATPNKLLNSEDGGYVKGLVTYMITDYLSVAPLSLISGLERLNMCLSPAMLEMKRVKFGVNEALRLLEASFRSETVLSDVFLAKEIDDVAVDKPN